MKVKINKLETLLANAAQKFVSLDEARYFAKETIDTHTKKFPRINPLNAAIKDLEAWKKNKKSKIKIQVEKPAILLLNFNRLGPSLKLKYIHDQLEKKARKNGIAAIGLNNSASINTLNLWTDGLGKRNLIGICLFNGGPGSVVPFGGTKSIFGTNPISYTIPTAQKPIIADMATAEVPFFEFRIAKEKGQKLRKGIIVDKLGNPTTNPKKGETEEGNARILPMGGGYKGYALVLLVEILTGSLVRGLLSSIEKSPSYSPHEYGGLLIAIDIASFTNVKKFKASVTNMCRAIRTQKPANLLPQVLIPGDQSYQRAQNILKSGSIEIEQKQLDKLKAL